LAPDRLRTRINDGYKENTVKFLDAHVCRRRCLVGPWERSAKSYSRVPRLPMIALALAASHLRLNDARLQAHTRLASSRPIKRRTASHSRHVFDVDSNNPQDILRTNLWHAKQCRSPRLTEHRHFRAILRTRRDHIARPSPIALSRKKDNFATMPVGMAPNGPSRGVVIEAVSPH